MVEKVQVVRVVWVVQVVQVVRVVKLDNMHKENILLHGLSHQISQKSSDVTPVTAGQRG